MGGGIGGWPPGHMDREEFQPTPEEIFLVYDTLPEKKFLDKGMDILEVNENLSYKNNFKIANAINKLMETGYAIEVSFTMRGSSIEVKYRKATPKEIKTHRKKLQKNNQAYEVLSYLEDAAQ